MDKNIKTEKVAKRQPKRDYIYAVGRQKEAVARVRLYSHVAEGQKWGELEVKKNQILVNGKPVEQYFNGPVSRASYMLPLTITNTVEKFAITVKIAGGGPNGQLDAMTKGIAKAISLFDRDKFRGTLKAKGLLSRDARVRQRRQVGTGGKARHKKQSPKR